MYFLLIFVLTAYTISAEDPCQNSFTQVLTSKFCAGIKTGCKEPRLGNQDERAVAFRRRVLTAERETILRPPNPIESEGNGDEFLVPQFAANFTKTLEHDPITGLLTAEGQKNYKRLLQALKTGKQEDFNSIVRAPNSTVKLTNPQAAFTFSLEGSDSSLFKIKPFPHLSSAEAAALLIEEYLMALTRDTTFDDYGTGLRTDADGGGGSITATAAAVLQDLGNAYKGPRNKAGQIDATVLFRGESQSDLVGPYISQFLLIPQRVLLPSMSGVQNLVQAPLLTDQQRPIAQKREFGVSFEDFVEIQNGKVPKQYTAQDYDPLNKRYIINGRDLGSFTLYDGPYEPYYNAVNILLSRGFPFSKVLPYVNRNIKNEAAFVTMGPVDVYSLIAGVAYEALKAVWAQKWRAHRSLRPEAFAGLVHVAKTTGTNRFNLHSSLFTPHNGIDVLALILKRNQEQSSPVIDPSQSLTFEQASTYLLAQMFPAGCPIHPSYPSGHATIAGACITVIKALFEDITKFASVIVPVKPDLSNPTRLVPLVGEGENEMTIASELDKLASNIAFGRNFTGMHYRADCEGILLGEEVAIRYLQDHGCTYTEQGFTGFVLTKRDGTRIRITPDKVTVLS